MEEKVPLGTAAVVKKACRPAVLEIVGAPAGATRIEPWADDSNRVRQSKEGNNSHSPGGPSSLP